MKTMTKTLKITMKANLKTNMKTSTITLKAPKKVKTIMKVLKFMKILMEKSTQMKNTKTNMKITIMSRKKKDIAFGGGLELSTDPLCLSSLFYALSKIR